MCLCWLRLAWEAIGKGRIKLTLMSRPSNQHIEKYYFELFARDFPLPTGQTHYGDKPDVIILGKEKVVGIEITNLYILDGSDEASEQVQRKRRLEVLKSAEAVYKSRSNLNYEFHVTFNPIAPIVDIQSTAKKLVDFVISIENTLGNFFTSNTFNISPEIYSVYRSPKEYTDAKWETTQFYNGKVLQATRVREIVQQKNEKISQYRPCQSYWLLLIVDHMDFAQDQEIDWPESESPIECKFEKVIVYKPQFKRFTDIPVRHI